MVHVLVGYCFCVFFFGVPLVLLVIYKRAFLGQAGRFCLYVGCLLGFSTLGHGVWGGFVFLFCMIVLWLYMEEQEEEVVCIWTGQLVYVPMRDEGDVL